MKIIELSLARNYVANWTLVDAIRELIANALDTGNADIYFSGSTLTVQTSSGAIPLEHLLLGSGSKTEDTDTIGQFNEGLKLALLILAREGIKNSITNGDETWTPYITKSDTFGIDCLHINIEGYVGDGEHESDEVTFILENLPLDVVTSVTARNLCFHEDLDLIETDNGDIIKDGYMKGQVFCGGVWVCEDSQFDYGYNFNTDILKLDRDRKTVSTFDISYQTKELWKLVDEDNSGELVKAIISSKEDTRYLNHHTHSISKSVANSVLDEVSDELDEDTVIVGSYDEHESLRSSGVKSKYISNETVISIIKKADNYKNPQDYMTKSLNPMDILVDFADEWADNMDSDLADAYQEMLIKLENLI